MDKTSIWEDIVAVTMIEKVRSKEITIRSTGHKKARVSVYLTGKANGMKLKTFMFKGAKRKTAKQKNEVVEL